MHILILFIYITLCDSEIKEVELVYSHHFFFHILIPIPKSKKKIFKKMWKHSPPKTSVPQEAGLRSPLVGEAERLCMDDMLKKYCGEFGWWQLRHFVLTSMAWALEAFHTMVVIFADREPAWRCVGGAGDCDMCGMEAGTWEWVEGKGSSTVAEFGLICGEKYKVGLVQALFFAGCMIGMFFRRLLFIFYFLFGNDDL